MVTTNLDYIPILIQFVFVAAFIAGMLALSHYVGPRRSSKNKDASFECGIPQHGNARIPFSVKYFLVAILFVLFDVLVCNNLEEVILIEKYGISSARSCEISESTIECIAGYALEALESPSRTWSMRSLFSKTPG